MPRAKLQFGALSFSNVGKTVALIFLRWSKSSWFILFNLIVVGISVLAHFTRHGLAFLPRPLMALVGVMAFESFMLLLALSWTRAESSADGGGGEMNQRKTRDDNMPPRFHMSQQVRAERISAAACSVVGHRKQNEDAYGIYTFPLGDSEGTLLVVCDGVGGEASGQQASREAVRLFAQLVPAISSLGLEIRDREKLSAAIDQHFQKMAHAFNSIAQRESLVGLTTTVVAALAHEDFLAYWWAGDSRAYLLRRGRLKLLSRDHSVPVERLNIDPLQVLDHEEKSKITRVLQPNASSPPEIGFVGLEDGDLVMLCSDGVWESCAHKELQGVTNYYLSSDLSLDLVSQYVLNALAINTSDNATLALYRQRSAPQPYALLHPGVLMTKGLRPDFLDWLYQTDTDGVPANSQRIANVHSSPPETLTKTSLNTSVGHAGDREPSENEEPAICLNCARTVLLGTKACCANPEVHSGFYVIVGDSTGKVSYHKISKPEATILGRAGGSDGVNIRDAQMANEHLKVEVNKDTSEVLFRDLDSDNGSFLSISSHRALIHDLDSIVFQLGKSRVQVLHTSLLGNGRESNK